MGGSSGVSVQRRDARENRQRILAAAREVFGEHGNATEIKHVAERAGVGVGTIYRHFESRRGLLQAVVRAAGVEFLALIKDIAVAEAPEHAFRSLMRIFAESHMKFGAALAEIAAAEHMSLEWDEDQGSLAAAFDEMLLRGIREGIFRKDLDLLVLRSTLESVFASGKLAELAVERGPGPAADAFSDLFLRGCGVTPAEPSP